MAVSDHAQLVIQALHYQNKDGMARHQDRSSILSLVQLTNSAAFFKAIVRFWWGKLISRLNIAFQHRDVVSVTYTFNTIFLTLLCLYCAELFKHYFSQQ